MNLAELFQQRGAEAVIAHAFDEPDDNARKEIFLAAHREIGKGEGHTGNLDGYVAVMRCGFDEMLRQAQLEKDPELAQTLRDRANMTCYNYATALAECWDSDPHPREKRHFEEGLRAAERCLDWRVQFNKPARSFSIAYWAKGVHELSLGMPQAADSFASATEHAKQIEGANITLEPGGDFFYLISEGYRGLALERAGFVAGTELLEKVLATFDEGLASDDEETREDCEIGATQLRCMRARLNARLGPI